MAQVCTDDSKIDRVLSLCAPRRYKVMYNFKKYFRGHCIGKGCNYASKSVVPPLSFKFQTTYFVILPRIFFCHFYTNKRLSYRRRIVCQRKIAQEVKWMQLDNRMCSSIRGSGHSVIETGAIR